MIEVAETSNVALELTPRLFPKLSSPLLVMANSLLGPETNPTKVMFTRLHFLFLSLY